MTREIGDALTVTGFLWVQDNAEVVGDLLVDGNFSSPSDASFTGSVTVGDAVKILAGASANDAKAGGILYVDSGSHANVTTGVTDLAQFSVIGDTLAVNNQSLVFKAWGTTSGTNTRTLKVLFGSDSWTIFSTTLAITQWSITGHIIRTGAATQDVVIDGVSVGGPGAICVISTATRTLASPTNNILKLTGQGSVSNEIIQEGFKVYWEDANT